MNYNCIGLLVQKFIPLCFFKTYTLYSLFNLPMTTVAASFHINYNQLYYKQGWPATAK